MVPVRAFQSVALTDGEGSGRKRRRVVNRSLVVPSRPAIRRMTDEDLPVVDRWLREPHVARWFLSETTAEAEVEKYRRRIEQPLGATTMCTVELGGRPIGWCQWYRWIDYPEEAASVGALEGEVGADYAIGELSDVGHGVGTAMIEALVAHVRCEDPSAGFVVAPEAANVTSRRVLEKNGFLLESVRPVQSEPHRRPMAIYRLDRCV